MAKNFERNLNTKLVVLMGVILATVMGTFYGATQVARDRFKEIYDVQFPILENAAITLLLLEKKEARLRAMVHEQDLRFLDEYSLQGDAFNEAFQFLLQNASIEKGEKEILQIHPAWKLEEELLKEVKSRSWTLAKSVISSRDFHMQQSDFKDRIQAIIEQLSAERSAFLRKQDRDVLATSIALLIVSVALVVLLALIILSYNKIVVQRDTAQQRFELERARMINNAKLASLGEMAGGIAHEINNPLAIIQGNGELIRDYVKMGTPEAYAKVEKLANGICETSRRISKIIMGLRRLSVGGAPQQDLEVISVLQILEDALAIFTERIRGKGVELRIEVAPDLLLKVRPHEIGQVFINLMNNAVDSLEMIEDHLEKRIEVSAKKQGGHIMISVVDSGAGVPPSVREKIFDPFFTTKEIGKGTGLGLSISKQIIRDYGGDLNCESEQGRTCFTVNLPSLS